MNNRRPIPFLPTILSINAGLAIATVAATEPPKPGADGWTPLFNGKDLDVGLQGEGRELGVIPPAP